jgi:hypothetical protein
VTITMEIDQIHDLIIRKGIGRITLDEIIGANADTWQYPGFHSGMDVIWDLRRAEVGHFSTEDLVALSRFLSRQLSWRGTHYKLALVATSEIDYIVSNTFSIIGQIEEIPITVQVFRNFKKAVSWELSESEPMQYPVHAETHQR